MIKTAYDACDWQALIDAHQLESHDPAEWLRYGVALLQTMEPGPDVGKQQQQAALAFMQAQKERASAEDVAAAQRQSVLLSLQEALRQADVAMPHHVSHKDADAAERRDLDPQEEPTRLDQTPPNEGWVAGREQPEDPLRVLTATMASIFGLKMVEPTTMLDQLLAAKQQLRAKGVDPASVELALRQRLPSQEPAWSEALHKLLLVLR
jgi:hypothetical protein